VSGFQYSPREKKATPLPFPGGRRFLFSGVSLGFSVVSLRFLCGFSVASIIQRNRRDTAERPQRNQRETREKSEINQREAQRNPELETAQRNFREEKPAPPLLPP
jgi:hypothetical protein